MLSLKLTFIYEFHIGQYLYWSASQHWCLWNPVCGILFSVPATWLQVHTRRRQQTQRRHSTRFQMAVFLKLVLHVTGHQSFCSDLIWSERNMKEYTRFLHLPSKSQTWISDGRFMETLCFLADLLSLGVSTFHCIWNIFTSKAVTTWLENYLSKHCSSLYPKVFLSLCWLLKFFGLITCPD